MRYKSFRDWNLLGRLLPCSQGGVPILNRYNPLNFELIIKDYSAIYEHVSFSKCKLLSDTTITDEAFEGVKLLYRAIEKQEEMCVYVNNLLDANVLFPLVQV